MSSLQLGFLAVYLSGRLFFYDMQIILASRNVRLSAMFKRILWGLWFVFIASDPVSFLVLFVLHLGLIVIDSFVRSRKINWNRWLYALHFVLLILGWGLVLPSFNELQFTPNNPFNLLQFFNGHDVILYLLIFDGFLFTQKEATIFIRLILQRLRAFPKQEPANRKRDRREYELGRVIGLLERTFLYFLIIWNQVGAIAVLIALKSLARFKDLEDRTFAEYFLIGSLLSILTAAVPAVVVLLVR